MRRSHRFNDKRRIAPEASFGSREREALSLRVRYGGNPEHKLHPNDYGLNPPIDPRPGKTLCDAAGPLPKTAAESLLRQAAAKGMVSVQQRGSLPQLLWAVSADGIAYEAQLENRISATYHGYPMPEHDAFRSEVLRQWQRR